MKKNAHVLYLTLLVTLLSSSSVYASNAALVPGIRDEALLSMSIVLNDPPASVFVSSDSPALVSENKSSLVLVVDAESVRHEDVGSSTFSSFTSEEINSEDDLKNYIKVLVRNNPDITSVSISGDKITIIRNTSGKFFGIVPVTAQETAYVTNWGDGTSEVRVSSPWWNFFSSHYTDDQITKDLYVRIKSIPSSLFVNSIHVQTQGRIVSEIEKTFNTTSTVATK